MKKEDLANLQNSIQNKLGEEHSALISDDLATIILDNDNMLSELESKNSQIKQLKDDKDKLIMTNNRLFQQVSVGQEETPKNKEKKKEKFSFKSVFDEKGNFIE